MPHFTHADADIFYTVHTTDGKSLKESDNKRPSILLIHGWTCDGHDWMFQIPHFLALGFNVIVPDMRGHGFSSAPQTGYTIEEFGADLVALVQHLGAQSIIIMGHSMGSFSLNHIAVKHSSLVKGVVLVDPAYGRDVVPEELREQIFSDRSARNWVMDYFEGSGFWTKTSPAWIRLMHERRVLGTPFHVLKGAADASNIPSESNWITKDQCAEGLKNRTMPRLAVYSAFLGSDGAQFERSLGVDETRDRVVFLEGVGHWPHQDVPDKFNGIVEDWFKLNNFL